MNHKKIAGGFGKQARRILLFVSIFASLNLISCGTDESETDGGIKQLTPEEQKDLARFVEYVLFSTAPYIDKSWIETDVPEDEVATDSIDFETETAAIQQVYTEFYNAYNQREMNALLTNVHPGGNEFNFSCGNKNHNRRSLSKSNLKATIHHFWHSWEAPCTGCQWGPTPTLTEFYIRPKNAQVPYPEASVKGFNSLCGISKIPGETYIYLIKKENKWLINQLVSSAPHAATLHKGKPLISKYFNDPKYKAPE